MPTSSNNNSNEMDINFKKELFLIAKPQIEAENRNLALETEKLMNASFQASKRKKTVATTGVLVTAAGLLAIGLGLAIFSPVGLLFLMLAGAVGIAGLVMLGINMVYKNKEKKLNNQICTNLTKIRDNNALITQGALELGLSKETTIPELYFNANISEDLLTKITNEGLPIPNGVTRGASSNTTEVNTAFDDDYACRRQNIYVSSGLPNIYVGSCNTPRYIPSVHGHGHHTHVRTNSPFMTTPVCSSPGRSGFFGQSAHVHAGGSFNHGNSNVHGHSIFR